MHRVTLTKRQSGFTLVELLIVAIILAILAAIIIPQFASTTTDAQESALRANLSALRSATSLYRQQHNGVNPGENVSSGVATCSSGVGAGIARSPEALRDQLTRYSNLLGQTCSLPETGFAFGPYIQEDALPTNPITGTGVFIITSTGNLNMTADGPGSTGGDWKYDSLSGKIIANDSNLDSAGNAYSTY